MSRKDLLLIWPDSMHPFGKLLGLFEVGQLALHPDGVAVGSVGDGPVDGAVAAALEAVVALAGPRGVPVEEDLDAGDAAGERARLDQRLALGLLEVLGNGVLLVDVRALVDGLDDGLVEPLQPRLRQPLVLDRLQLVADLARLLGRQHQVVQRLQIRVGSAEDEGVVAGVDGRRDERCCLGVGASDGE